MNRKLIKRELVKTGSLRIVGLASLTSLLRLRSIKIPINLKNNKVSHLIKRYNLNSETKTLLNKTIQIIWPQNNKIIQYHTTLALMQPKKNKNQILKIAASAILMNLTTLKMIKIYKKVKNLKKLGNLV